VATRSSTCRTGRIGGLQVDAAHNCARGYRPANLHGYRFMIGWPKAAPSDHFRYADAVSTNAAFTFDSSQHLSPRSKLLPNSDVAGSAQDVASQGT